jgi:hypothetical protein
MEHDIERALEVMPPGYEEEIAMELVEHVQIIVTETKLVIG